MEIQIHPQSEEYFGNVNYRNKSCYDEGKRIAESLTNYMRNHNTDK